jgi:diguanylate cyclase (GGDEF)-like protein/PAS domain S-box-containing protein
MDSDFTQIEQALRESHVALRQSREETRQMVERYLLLADAAQDALWDWDLVEYKFFVSDRLYEMLGYSKDEYDLCSADLLKLIHPDDRDSGTDGGMFHESCPQSEGAFCNEQRLMMRSGEYKWFLIRGKNVYDSEGKIIRRAGSLTDITERKLYEEEIRQLAYFDGLTGLPNRTYVMHEMLDNAKRRVPDSKYRALIFIDVDNFKYINDHHSHAVGDSLLLEVTRRLKLLTGSDTWLARTGGDEFVLLQSTGNSLEFVDGLAESIVQLFAEPFTFAGNSFYITVSAGIAVYPQDGDNIELLMKHAELAMYQAKEAGKNAFSFFNNDMASQMREKVNMDKHLRDAIRNHEFHLHYQPQFDVTTGAIKGFEALLRWNSPVYGKVSPVKFIPVAEESGLIIEIGQWVLNEVFAFAASISHLGLCVSCNISAMQLQQSYFVEEVTALFDHYQLKRGSVALEITESCLLDSFEQSSQKLAYLQNYGLLIYLDDFGTGYSSLTYLKKLPINVVKIDKSFIDEIVENVTDRRIVQAIVSLAREIGLDVVVEGVETKPQYHYLSESSCQYVQGYLISRPVPEQQALQLLDQSFDYLNN